MANSSPGCFSCLLPRQRSSKAAAAPDCSPHCSASADASVVSHPVTLPREQLLPYLLQHGRTLFAYSTLQPGMHHFLIPGVGYISYGLRRPSESRSGGRQQPVVLGDPICAPEHKQLLAQAFLKRWPKAVWLGVTRDMAELLQQLGLLANCLGGETAINPTSYTLSGTAKRGIKSAISGAVRAGVTVEWLSPLNPQLAGEMRGVADAWAGARPSGAADMWFINRQPVYQDEPGVLLLAARGADGVMQAWVAFDPLWEGGQVVGYYANIVRHRPDAHTGAVNLIMKTFLDSVRPAPAATGKQKAAAKAAKKSKKAMTADHQQFDSAPGSSSSATTTPGKASPPAPSWVCTDLVVHVCSACGRPDCSACAATTITSSSSNSNSSTTFGSSSACAATTLTSSSSPSPSPSSSTCCTPAALRRTPNSSRSSSSSNVFLSGSPPGPVEGPLKGLPPPPADLGTPPEHLVPAAGSIAPLATTHAAGTAAVGVGAQDLLPPPAGSGSPMQGLHQAAAGLAAAGATSPPGTSPPPAAAGATTPQPPAADATSRLPGASPQLPAPVPLQLLSLGFSPNHALCDGSTGLQYSPLVALSQDIAYRFGEPLYPFRSLALAKSKYGGGMVLSSSSDSAQTQGPASTHGKLSKASQNREWQYKDPSVEYRMHYICHSSRGLAGPIMLLGLLEWLGMIQGPLHATGVVVAHQLSRLKQLQLGRQGGKGRKAQKELGG